MLYRTITPALLVLVGLGLYGAFSVSYGTFTEQSPCPSVMSLPICYMVFMGYLVMFLSLLCAAWWRSSSIFMAGWAPVFIVAISGTYFELQTQGSCPYSESGIPLCFVSLGLSIMIFLLFQWCRRFEPIDHDHDITR